MSFGNGTYKEVDVRALDPFLATCIKHAGGFHVIIADNREIIECLKMLSHEVKVLGVGNAGKDFLAHRSDEDGAQFPYKLRQFVDQHTLPWLQVSPPKRKRPDGRVNENPHFLVRAFLWS